MATVTYARSLESFTNPERGWTTGGAPENYANAASRGITVVMRYVRLDAYRASALPPSFLAQLDAELSGARAHGLKIVLRFSYNFGFEPDASLDRVLQHIEQLEPVLAANTDVIAAVQAGFIGAWGEWHSSTNGLTDVAARQAIATALLAALDTSRMVQVRTPYYARDLFHTPPDWSTAFDGSDRSRVAQKNDCFLTNESDAGTYLGAEDWAYAEAVTRFTVMGGETCEVGGLNARNDGAVAVMELARFNFDYLQIDWWRPVIDKWQSQGYFDEIDRRLGYRFVMLEATSPVSIRAGDAWAVNLRLRNEGFGKVYNPRPFDLVLRPVSGGSDVRLRAYADARRVLPLGGETRDIPLTVQVPSSLAAGTYDVLVGLPDAAPTLAADSRYAIRFANVDVWEGGSGLNALGLQVEVRR